MSTIDAQKFAAIVASFSKEMNPEAYYQLMQAEEAQEEEDSCLLYTSKIKV